MGLRRPAGPAAAGKSRAVRLLREGLAADICIFDPEKIIDHATYTDPFRYNDGIEHVIVNGKPVLKHGQHTGAKPGVVLRHNHN